MGRAAPPEWSRGLAATGGQELAGKARGVQEQDAHKAVGGGVLHGEGAVWGTGVCVSVGINCSLVSPLGGRERDTPSLPHAHRDPARVSGAGGGLPLLCTSIPLRPEACDLPALPTPRPGSMRTIPETGQGLSLHLGLLAPNPRTLSPDPPREGPDQPHGQRPESTPNLTHEFWESWRLLGRHLAPARTLLGKQHPIPPWGPELGGGTQEEGGGGAVSVSQVSTEALSSGRHRDSVQCPGVPKGQGLCPARGLGDCSQVTVEEPPEPLPTAL